MAEFNECGMFDVLEFRTQEVKRGTREAGWKKVLLHGFMATRYKERGREVRGKGIREKGSGTEREMEEEGKFPLTLMGVLATGSAHVIHFAPHPINMIGIFWHNQKKSKKINIYT
jgi:hypothetical protein